MNNNSEIIVAPTIATRYESLIQVSREIGLHRDPKELFAALASELHRVVSFDYIGVSLRHQESDTFLYRFVDMEVGPMWFPTRVWRRTTGADLGALAGWHSANQLPTRINHLSFLAEHPIRI